MKVPYEENSSDPDKEFLSFMQYGLQIHELCKLKIDNIKIKLKNTNGNENSLLEYYNLLCYRVPNDSGVYFYFNFHKYYRLYPGQLESGEFNKKFPYPYEITLDITDKEKEENNKLELVFTIIGYNEFGLHIDMIKNKGLALYHSHGTVYSIMTEEQNQKLIKIKEEYNKYKKYFK